MSSAVRTFALALAVVLALFWATVLITTFSSSVAVFGWNLGPDGTTLTYVTPGGAAWNAGIRPGDRVDWSRLSLLGRANLTLVQAVAAGSRLRVTYRQGTATRARTIVAQTAPVRYATAALNASGLILMVIGIALVWLRPTRMTWAFLASSLTWADPYYVVLWGQNAPWNFLVANGSQAIISGLSVAGVLIFMSRFPGDRPRGPLKLLDSTAIPLGAIVAALGLSIVADISASTVSPPTWVIVAYQYVTEAFLVLVAFAALIVAYALTKGSDRQRIIPVLLAFTLYVVSTVARNVYANLYTDLTSMMVSQLLTAVSMLALAAAVAYGVARHRVVDVSFAISRTLVYTLLTSLLVGAFVLIDFLSSKILDKLQIALAIEACVALAFGMSLNALHTRIDRLVDRVLFRRRHAAEARLERTARTLVHAESATFIDEALVIEPCEALSLTSAAVFRTDGNAAFARVSNLGWDEGNLRRLTPDDHLVVNLRAELEAIDLSDLRWPRTEVPGGVRQPLLALPFVVRHELLGFVLYGGHVGGEAIDPDERRTLEHLAETAAAAYEHVRSKALFAELDALRAQNSLLQHDKSLLQSLLEASALSHAPPAS